MFLPVNSAEPGIVKNDSRPIGEMPHFCHLKLRFLDADATCVIGLYYVGIDQINAVFGGNLIESVFLLRARDVPHLRDARRSNSRGRNRGRAAGTAAYFHGVNLSDLRVPGGEGRSRLRRGENHVSRRRDAGLDAGTIRGHRAAEGVNDSRGCAEALCGGDALFIFLPVLLVKVRNRAEDTDTAVA